MWIKGLPPAADREPRWPRWVAASFGFLWFLVLGGAYALGPTHIDWLMREDWFAHLSGWLFFRIAPWQLPLGSAPSLLFPYGTSVAFTDGNPWLAVFAKLLSPLLPEDFQYIGLWLCSCFVLIGYFGSRLTSVFTADPLRQMLGGVLCTLTPVVPAGFGHPTLCAHWLLMAAFWLNLRQYSSKQQARSALVLALGLNILAAGLHPYWVVMLEVLWLALLVRIAFLERWLSWTEASVGAVALADAPYGVLLLFGYVGGNAPALGAEGFGTFSADLTSLFNPGNLSRLFPPIPVNPRQAEGYGYLGLGILALLAFAVASWLARPTARWPLTRALPLALAVLGMTLYALSSIVAWRGRPVLDLTRLYVPLGFLTAPFRASGRFIWPAHYFLLAVALSSQALWNSRRMFSAVVLGAAIFLQLCDLDFRQSKLWRDRPVFTPLRGAVWDGLHREYQHLSIFPVQAQWTCRYDEALVTHLTYLAYRQRMTFNSGYASRTPEEIRTRCTVRMSPGGVDDQTVYFPQGEAFRDFVAAGATCGVLGGLVVCVSEARGTHLRNALLGRP